MAIGDAGQGSVVTGEPLVQLDYCHILASLADPVVAADATNRIVYVNLAAERLLGWPAGELVGQPLTAIQPPRFHAAHLEGFHRFVTTGTARIMGRPVRVAALHRNGTEIDIELSLSSIPLTAGQPLVVASLRDLRDRVELERQLTVTRYLRAATEAAARLTSLLALDHVLQTVVDTLVADFDSALARIWLYDAATNTLHLRASAGLSTQTTGSSRAHIDVAGYPYKVGEVARTRRPFIKNGLAGDPQFDQEWVAREGMQAVAAFPLLIGGELRGVMVHFSRHPLLDEVIDVLSTFVAITTASLNDVLLFQREQEARADAEAAHRRFAFLEEASRTLASSLDYETTLANVARLTVPHLADWCIVDMLEPDGTVRRLAVAQPDDPGRIELARQLETRYPAEPRSEEALDTVLRTGQPVMVSEISETMLAEAARDEEHLRILLALGLESYMCVPLVAHGRTLGAISFISGQPGRTYGPQDLERAEDLCRRAAIAVDNARLYREVQQAVRERDEFLSSVSHDLKNPVAAIKGQAQVLQRWASRLQGPELERIQRGLERIDTTASRMTRLINGLVDMAHLRAGRPLELRREPGNLMASIRQVVAEQQQTTSQHSIHLESALSELAGTWDLTRLERVLANLLSNAIKYSPDGREIVVGVSRVEGDGGPAAEIAIRDRGIGIPEDDLPQIFQRFYRGSNVVGRIEGNGIGLAGARQIVEQHGGSITAESREGEGTTFTVRLPLASMPKL